METRTGVRRSRWQRRIALVIAVVVVGLMLAALFWLRWAAGPAAARPLRGGLNPALPAAHFKSERPLDKLSVYEKVDRDSARRLEREKVFGQLSFGAVAGVADSSAARLLGQLDKLKQLVRPPRMEDASGADGSASPGIRLFRPSAPESSSREQLEELLRRMHRPDTGGSNPQLDQLSGMLDKVLRIKRGPVGMVDSNKQMARGPEAMLLEQPRADSAVKDLAAGGWVPEQSEGYERGRARNEALTKFSAGGFFGLDGEDVADTVAAGNAFEAVIPEEQVLVAGATVTLRLLQEVRIGRVLAPRDQLVYGKAALSGDRLLVSINSIRVGGSVYPVALQAYDLDGLAGIHVPGAITRDVLKQSAAEGVTGLGLAEADPSLGAQAASAGIEAARSLLSRKISLVRVTVPAGHLVLLKNLKSDNH